MRKPSAATRQPAKKSFDLVSLREKVRAEIIEWFFQDCGTSYSSGGLIAMPKLSPLPVASPRYQLQISTFVAYAMNLVGVVVAVCNDVSGNVRGVEHAT